MLQSLKHHLGVRASQLTLVVPVVSGGRAYRAAVHPDAWPACLASARGAVVVRVADPHKPKRVAFQAPVATVASPPRTPGHTGHTGHGHIYVTTVRTHTFALPYRPHEGVGRIKDVVHARKGVHPAQQRVSFAGQTLGDGTLAQHGVGPGARLYVLLGRR
jgi:hypothetical protein